MEKLCGRVRPEDGPALQELVTPIRERALAAAQDFLLLQSNPAPCPRWSDPPSTGPSVDQEGDEPTPLCQAQLRLPEIPAQQNAAESWDSLEEVRPVALSLCSDQSDSPPSSLTVAVQRGVHVVSATRTVMESQRLVITPLGPEGSQRPRDGVLPAGPRE